MSGPFVDGLLAGPGGPAPPAAAPAPWACGSAARAGSRPSALVVLAAPRRRPARTSSAAPARSRCGSRAGRPGCGPASARSPGPPDAVRPAAAPRPGPAAAAPRPSSSRASQPRSRVRHGQTQTHPVDLDHEGVAALVHRHRDRRGGQQVGQGAAQFVLVRGAVGAAGVAGPVARAPVRGRRPAARTRAGRSRTGRSPRTPWARLLPPPPSPENLRNPLTNARENYANRRTAVLRRVVILSTARTAGPPGSNLMPTVPATRTGGCVSNRRYLLRSHHSDRRNRRTC